MKHKAFMSQEYAIYLGYLIDETMQGDTCPEK